MHFTHFLDVYAHLWISAAGNAAAAVALLEPPVSLQTLDTRIPKRSAAVSAAAPLYPSGEPARAARGEMGIGIGFQNRSRVRASKPIPKQLATQTTKQSPLYSA